MICAGEPRIKYNKTLADYGIGADEITPHRPPGPRVSLFTDPTGSRTPGDLRIVFTPAGLVHLPPNADAGKVASALALFETALSNLPLADAFVPELLTGFRSTKSGSIEWVTSQGKPVTLEDGTPVVLTYSELQAFANQAARALFHDRVDRTAAGAASDIQGFVIPIPARGSASGASLTVTPTGLALRFADHPPEMIAFSDNPLAAPMARILFERNRRDRNDLPFKSPLPAGMFPLSFNAELQTSPPRSRRPRFTPAIFRPFDHPSEHNGEDLIMPRRQLAGAIADWRNPPTDPERWVEPDFVWHYWTGGGEAVSLTEAKLAETFESAAPLRAETERFMAATLARRRAGLAPGGDWQVLQFNLTGVPGLFVIGNTTLLARSDCDDRKCRFTFMLDDKFTDPFDISEIAGFVGMNEFVTRYIDVDFSGTPFPFKHTFSRERFITE